MLIHLYPKSISFYGGGKAGGSGGAGSAGAEADEAWGRDNYVNTVAGDPNGVVITASSSLTNSGSAWADCDSGANGRHHFWHDLKRSVDEAWTVGRGYKAVHSYVRNEYGQGGDLYCFGFDSNYELGHVVFNANYNIEHQYQKLAWPKELIITKMQASWTNPSQSWTQLANGYFTGPRTYKTTGTKWGFTIQNKTSLKWSNYSTDITIEVTAPHTTQKTMPEHFLWVAGGFGNDFGVSTRAVEVGVCYCDFRGDIDNSIGYVHPNYRKLIGSVKSTMSASSEGFTLSGTGYPNGFSTLTVGSSGTASDSGFSSYSATFIDLAGVDATYAGWVHGVEASVKTKGWKDNTGYYDNEEPWPIIDTEQIVGNKVVFTLTNSNIFHGGMFDRPVYTGAQDEDGSYYLSTSTGKSEVAYFGVATSQQYKTSNKWGYNFTGGNRSFYGHERDYYITQYKEFGLIQRGHKTSQRGYYFTNPDIVFKNAKDVDTYYDVSTYSCHDATCIDIQRYAKKEAFQTAKTSNNSIVEVTLRVPRTATKTTKDTISLASTQSYITYQKAETRIWDDRYDSAPVWGHPKYEKNEYGEDASYSFTGFKTTTVDQTATRLVPVSNTGVAYTYYGGAWYDSPAYAWYYNPWQNGIPV